MESEILKKIKEVCKNHSSCNGCRFHISVGSYADRCLINDYPPENWDIREIEKRAKDEL